MGEEALVPADEAMGALPWLRPPPRTGTSTYATLMTQGTFLKQPKSPQVIRVTRPDTSVGLSRLVSGSPVVPKGTVQVPHVHRATSVPVRMASPKADPLHFRRNHYPRHGWWAPASRDLIR